MTKFRRLDQPQRPEGFFEYSSEETKANHNRCSFEFDPEDWSERTGFESTLDEHELGSDGNWHCEFPTHKEYDRCVFHLDSSKKSAKVACRQFAYLLEDRSESLPESAELVGAQFEYLDLRGIRARNLNTSIIDLRHARFDKGAYFEKCKLPEVKLTGAQFGDVLGLNNVSVDGDLSLTNTRFQSGNDTSIFIDGCEIEGGLSANKSNIEGEVILVNTEVEHGIDFRQTAFHTGIDLFRSSAGGKVEFFHSNILGSISSEEDTSLRIQNCLIEGQTHLQHLFTKKAINAQRSQYLGGLVLMHLHPNHWINLSNCEIQDNCILEGMYIPGTVISMNNSNITGEIELVNTRYTDPENNLLEVHFVNANLKEGNIYQSSGGETICHFEMATIGEINFKHQSERTVLNPFPNNILRSQPDSVKDRSVFEYLSISDTTFEGFDFGDYRWDLEEVNWQLTPMLHDRGQRELELTIEEQDNEGTERQKVIDANLLDNEIRERTYLKAKNGAKKSGDEIAASKFFIREMQFRKARFRGQTLSNLKNPLSTTNIISSVSNGVRWQLNSLLEALSSYGEKIWPVIIYSMILIIQGALLLPIDGGFQNSTETYSYAAVRYGELGLVELLGQSLYFSTVTFSTVGYGDYMPTRGFPQLAAGGISLLGALLIAFLIFTLGRRVAR